MAEAVRCLGDVSVLAALSVFWPSEMPSHLVSPKRCGLHLVWGLRGWSRPFSSFGPYSTGVGQCLPESSTMCLDPNL